MKLISAFFQRTLTLSWHVYLTAGCVWLLLGCASGLPDVQEPLTPTPDADFRKSRPPQAEKWKFSLPQAEVKQLQNGLHVAAVKRPGSGTVEIFLVNREAGDPWFATKPGLASLMNNTLLEGSILPDGSRVRHLGIPESKVSVRTGGFSSLLNISALEGALGSALSSLAWTAKYPSFSEVAVQHQEANSFFEDQLSNESLDRELVESLYSQVVGKNHWLAKGHRKIPRYVSADVQREYRRLTSPHFCLLLVVGDFDEHAKIFELVESQFGDWKSQTTTPPSSSLERGYAKRLSADWQRARSARFMALNGLDDAHLLMLLPGVAPGKAGEAAYLLALAHLQSFRPGGIGDQLREQTQSIYGMHAVRNMHPAGAETLLWVPVRPSHATNAALQIISSLNRLGAEGLSKTRLSVLKSEYLTQVAGTLQSNWGIAAGFANVFVHNGADDLAHGLERFIGSIQAVTPADIRQVAQTVLNPVRAAILIAGPREASDGLTRLH